MMKRRFVEWDGRHPIKSLGRGKTGRLNEKGSRSDDKPHFPGLKRRSRLGAVPCQLDAETSAEPARIPSA